jgi:hypothetical protein
MAESTEWRRFFERNARSLLAIPWHAGADLTAEEAALIASSLQEFQAGERSEGRHLYKFAQEYAARTGDHDYVAAIRLFIAEEQRHARDLGRFLTLNGIPVIATTFADRVFRGLRNFVPSLEISIAVLITAELIAKVYYAGLREATSSVVLRRLCDQILADEWAHVEFQSGQLRRLRASRGRLASWVTLAIQRALYAGTLLVVWRSHGPVMRGGGLTFGGYWSWSWREFRSAFSSGQVLERDQPPAQGLNGRLSAVLDLELGEKVRDVRLDGLLADIEGQRDVAVGAAEPKQPQHLTLSPGEIGPGR